MGNIFLRSAVQEDGPFLFELVNDRECRENSLSSQQITYDEHLLWMEKILHSSTDKQYILMDGTIPVGQGRLEMEDNTSRISYSIIPERRGCGYGKILIQLLNNSALKDFPDCKHSYGQVLKRNIASQKIFEELEYTVEEQKDYFIYRKKIEYYEINHNVKFRGGVLLLSNNRNSFALYDWLSRSGKQVFFYSGKLTEAQILFLSPQMVVSYNYSYMISESVIQLLRSRIINLHISYLPWNKGSDPNFWSFIDETPKGVTIHQLSPALDQGDILLQKELFFNEKKETFKSAYETLNREIVQLFIKYYDQIIDQKIISHPQHGVGSYHRRKDLIAFMDGATVDWDEIIYDFKQRMM